MAVFCPYKLPALDVEVRAIAWSRDHADNALLAVATDTHVRVYNDEGEPVGEPLSRGATFVPEALEWAANHPVLLVGWSTGHLSVCREDAGGWCRQKESSDLHKHAICKITFSPAGNRCVVCDVQGLVSVWKTVDGAVIPMCHYSKLGKHDHVAFRTLTKAGDYSGDPPFFFVGEKGIVYLGDDYGLCSERYRVGQPVTLLEYVHSQDKLVMITQNMTLVSFSFDSSFEVVNETKMKLAVVHPDQFRGTFAGPGVLATCAGEALIRLWAIEEDEWYILPLDVAGAPDKAVSISYNPRKRTLAAGTRDGRVVQWRSICAGAPTSDTMWESLPPVEVGQLSLHALGWGPGEKLLYARAGNSITVLSETQLGQSASQQWVAVQKLAAVVTVQHLPSGAVFVIETTFRCKGVAVLGSTLVVWSNRQLQAYVLSPQGVSVGQSFNANLNVACVAEVAGEQVCFVANEQGIEQLTMSGISRQSVALTDAEGTVAMLDAVEGALVAVTTKGYLKLFAIKSSMLKPVGTARRFEVAGASPGEIRSVRLNASGSCASMIVEKPTGHRSLFVYEAEADRFSEFVAGEGQQIVSHMWEVTDPRMLAVEVTAPMATDDDAAPPEPEVITLFVRAEDIVVQEHLKKEPGVMAACVIVPHVYFANVVGEAKQLTKRVLSDYAGLENSEPHVLKALRDFSFHIAAGNTDEAYRCVEGIQSRNVWENLAKMCVKTRRIDVAEKCLGQMKHLRAASALREARSLEPDAQLAVVATHLDMVEEAAELYSKCGRYDKLNLLHQACGEWDKAVEVAEKHDRIHLLGTYFAYAQHLEGMQDVAGCMKYYELADAARSEIPRVLSQHGLVEELQQYVHNAGDANLYRWYAQFLESKSDLDGAANEYRKAEDHLSLCRIACFAQGIEAAQQICTDSGSKSACYHLARHLEADGRSKEAIHFYSLSGRVGHALRLAQSQGLDNELMHLALGSGNPAQMIQAGRYCEQSGQPQKAVTLYHKAGSTARALELCFSARLFDQLRKIAEDLRPDSGLENPEILARVGEFFLQNQQHEKAIHILGMSKQFETAIDLCSTHDVPITEDMAERMTPDKKEMEASVRNDLLTRIAKLCKKQGKFQLACKKYTQAGDKTRAMKALLQSGDTEKIIFFAGTARQNDVYLLAANYLQSLDWHEEDIMKNIILFYTKAKEFEKLGTFYEHCAQAEIDEYRDYEKAAGALKESLKYLKKESPGQPPVEPSRLDDIGQRIGYIEKFAAARKKEGPQMMAACEELLQNPDSERGVPVRVGDIFALMVEYYYSQADYVQSYESIERMVERRIILEPYLDRKMVEQIYREVGQPLHNASADDDGIDEEVEEEVEELDDDGRV